MQTIATTRPTSGRQINKRHFRGLIPVVLALTTGVVSPVSAQTPSFQSLGQMPGSLYGTYANAVSANGDAVVGYAWVSSNNRQAFRWTRTNGFQSLGDLGGGDSDAYATSFDGAVVVGQSAGTTGALSGFRWTLAGGMTALPFYEATAVSADGSMAAGMNVWWKTSGEMGTFGFFPGSNNTSTLGLSADGQVAVGAAIHGAGRFGPTHHAFRWTPLGGLQDLGVTTGDESDARAVSGDGQVIVGEARDKSQFWRAFRWTASGGMRDIGTLGGPMSVANAASQNGAVVVGTSLTTGLTSSNRAFRWTAKKGLQDLKKELQSAGIHTADNWILSSASGVSADGTVIVGYGFSPSSQWESFRIVLPLPK